MDTSELHFANKRMDDEPSNLKVNLTSKIQELELHHCQIEISAQGKEVVQHFNSNSTLPGVILVEKCVLIGMVSRRKFLEQMSRPYSLELFYKRPLNTLYNFIRTDILILSGHTSIVEAVHLALERPPELLEEPLVVELALGVYKLLDIHHLLLAYAQIHCLATNLITRLYKKLTAANKQLKHIAALDGLTQIANRRQFDECLHREWKRATREKNWISLIICDVDCFKSYNDSYGHLAGDECLRQVAKAIEQSVKRPGDLAARYGGEEFAVVLSSTEASGATCVAQEIRHKIAELKLVHDYSKASNYVTVSVGIASMIPHPEESLGSIITAADSALYRAKQQGRDRYVIYSPEWEQNHVLTNRVLVENR